MKSIILESALALRAVLSLHSSLNESKGAIPEITPRNICTFYVIEYVMSSGDGNEDFQYLAEDYLEKLATKYVNVFGDLIQKQIQKYIDRGRTDPNVSLDSASRLPMQRRVSVLADLMKKTFRSDMSRRNDRWNELADYIVKLNNAKDTKTTLYLIDRINNAVHNTKTQILDKLPNSRELLAAFNAAHEAGVNSPKKNPLVDHNFMDKVDESIKRALRTQLGNR